LQGCWEFLHRRHPKPCAPLARLSNQSTSAQMRWDAWCRKELNRGHLCLVGEVDNARACSCHRRGRMHMHAGSGWRARARLRSRGSRISDGGGGEYWVRTRCGDFGESEQAQWRIWERRRRFGRRAVGAAAGNIEDR